MLWYLPVGTLDRHVQSWFASIGNVRTRLKPTGSTVKAYVKFPSPEQGKRKLLLRLLLLCLITPPPRPCCDTLLGVCAAIRALAWDRRKITPQHYDHDVPADVANNSWQYAMRVQLRVHKFKQQPPHPVFPLPEAKEALLAAKRAEEASPSTTPKQLAPLVAGVEPNKRQRVMTVPSHHGAGGQVGAASFAASQGPPLPAAAMGGAVLSNQPQPGAAEAADAVDANAIRLIVPQGSVPNIVGPRGAVLRSIEAATQCSVQLQQAGGARGARGKWAPKDAHCVVVIKGPPDNCQQAHAQVMEAAMKSKYMTLEVKRPWDFRQGGFY